MRMRGPKLRAFALINVVAALCGCVAGNGKVLAESSKIVLTGRILSVAEVTIFEGDLALIGYSYMVEPQSQPGGRLVVVGDRSDCPIAGDNSAIYSLRLERRSMYFGIKGKADKKLMSELYVAECERLPTQSIRGRQ